MRLDVVAARHAVQQVAAALGMEVEAAAAGIVAVANEHMAQALRVISVQRGVDPGNHVLVSFGGAGGLHVCALAEALGMSRALVPLHAGVLSALGMLVAPRARQLSRTLTGALAGFTADALQQQLEALAEAGRAELQAEGVASNEIQADFSLDLRYRGQSSTLTLIWQGIAATEAAFHRAHAQRYGHRLDTPVELVNLRCNLHGAAPPISLPDLPPAQQGAVAPRHASVYGCTDEVPVWPRARLGAGATFAGPVLITETVATTWLPAGWHCQVDSTGSLLLVRE
jgi:N-methylhydantoinase A